MSKIFEKRANSLTSKKSETQMYSKCIEYTDFTMTLLGLFFSLPTSSLVSLLCSHHCAFPTLKKKQVLY